MFRTGQSVTLARALPIFTQMGIEVLDERPYEIDLADGHNVWIYDFGLRLPAGTEFDEVRSRNVIEAVRLLWLEQIEQDGFNALVVRSTLTWWQVNILRAYAKYLRQAGTTFSQGYIEQALIDHAPIAAAHRRALRVPLRPRPRERDAGRERRHEPHRRDRGGCSPTSPASTRTASSARCSVW